MSFDGDSSAENATITINGAPPDEVVGASVAFNEIFQGTATADNATFIINGGINGGIGGTLSFGRGSLGGTAQVKMSGNGTLDLTGHDPGTVSIGSLAGKGLVLLGTTNLTVGTNNLTTAFAGNISDNIQAPGASFTKTGSGTLTVSAANAYDGGTFVQGRGILFVNNATGSGTGTGTVQINSGVLGGNGIISGPVLVGNGIPAAASLMPGKSNRSPAVLTIGQALTFNADATYLWLLDSVRGIASSVVTKGVTIDSAALFSPNELQSATLSTGTVFTVITNNGAAAILGSFSNLPDGGTIKIGNNTFQANYEGGDGNDLTLTVVP
jgi:autotransporter-associated beta strand protein